MSHKISKMSKVTTEINESYLERTRGKLVLNQVEAQARIERVYSAIPLRNRAGMEVYCADDIFEVADIIAESIADHFNEDDYSRGMVKQIRNEILYDNNADGYISKYLNEFEGKLN